jgi:PST family polysaccharide transporter
MSALQSWTELALIAPAAWLAVRDYGVEGAAAARTAVGLAMVPLMLLLAARSGAGSIRQLLARLWRPVVAAAAVIALTVDTVPTVYGSVFLTLIIKLAASAVVYPCTLLVLWVLAGRPAGVEPTALAHLRAWLRRSDGTDCAP